MRLNKRIEQLEAVSIKPEAKTVLVRIVGLRKDPRKLIGIKGVPFTLDDGETEESFFERAEIWIRENHKGVFLLFSIYEDDALRYAGV